MPPVGERLWAQGQGVRSLAPLQACLKEQCCLFFIRLSSRSCFFSFSRDIRSFHLAFQLWLPFPRIFHLRVAQPDVHPGGGPPCTW